MAPPRRRPARRTRRHRGAIAVALLGAGHGLVDQHDLAGTAVGRRGFQFGQAVEHHHLARDAAGGRGRAVAQPQQRQLVRHGPRSRRFPGRAARRFGKGLDMDIGEAQRLQLGHAPVAGARLRRGSRRAAGRFGGEGFRMFQAVSSCSAWSRRRAAVWGSAGGRRGKSTGADNRLRQFHRTFLRAGADQVRKETASPVLHRAGRHMG